MSNQANLHSGTPSIKPLTSPVNSNNDIKIEAHSSNVSNNQGNNNIIIQGGQFSILPPERIDCNDQTPVQSFTGYRSKLLRYGQRKKYFVSGETIDKLKTAVNCVRLNRKTTWQEGTIILHGLGGIGKSQISQKIAELFSNDFDYIYTFDLNSESSLKAGFIAIVEALERKIHVETLQDIIDSMWNIYHKLGTTYSSGLLLFENADHLEARIEELFPKENHFHIPVIIVLSRNSNPTWMNPADKIKTVNVNCLGLDDSTTLFSNIFGFEPPIFANHIQDGGELVLHHLNGYPLGIELVATYIQRWIARFNSTEDPVIQCIRILNANNMPKLLQVSGLEKSLQNIFVWTLEKIQNSSHGGERAMEILRHFALSDHLEIDVGIINETCTPSDQQNYSGNHQFEFAEEDTYSGLELLTDFSLIQKEGCRPSWFHQLFKNCCKVHLIPQM